MQLDVIIIDDIPANISLLSRLIRKLDDCTPREFTNPEAALAWCMEHVPDLIIIDYMMPGMNGIEFIRQFRACPGRKDIPVLMVTADNQTSVLHSALDAGANDFLSKPIDILEFKARARNMLSLRLHQRQLADHSQWLTEEVRKATSELRLREKETIIRLSKAADSRDPETGAHILRMAHFSKLIAANLGLSAQDQEMLLDAAPMHDIGKVGVPDHILLKPGRLDVAEFEIMKQHSVLGFNILNGSQSVVLKAAAQIALAHHEKFDGSGYPHGLVGEAIPLFARICAVADVFDALTSERVYKKAWNDERAIALLREGAGYHFDPACVDAFLLDWDAVMAIRERFCDELSA